MKLRCLFPAGTGTHRHRHRRTRRPDQAHTQSRARARTHNTQLDSSSQSVQFSLNCCFWNNDKCPQIQNRHLFPLGAAADLVAARSDLEVVLRPPRHAQRIGNRWSALQRRTALQRRPRGQGEDDLPLRPVGACRGAAAAVGARTEAPAAVKYGSNATDRSNAGGTGADRILAECLPAETGQPLGVIGHCPDAGRIGAGTCRRRAGAACRRRPPAPARERASGGRAGPGSSSSSLRGPPSARGR